jgi:hypothetical protein
MTEQTLFSRAGEAFRNSQSIDVLKSEGVKFAQEINTIKESAEGLDRFVYQSLRNAYAYHRNRISEASCS